MDDVVQPMTIATMLLYVGVQIMGSFAAAAVASYVNESQQSIVAPMINTDSHSRLSALVVELLFSFLLVITVLSSATCPKVKGNSFFGMAVGFVVTAGVATVADISGMYQCNYLREV